MTFADLDRARQHAGLTVTRLCLAAGVPRSTWWRWSKSTHEPSRSVKRKFWLAIERQAKCVKEPPPSLSVKLRFIRVSHELLAEAIQGELRKRPKVILKYRSHNIVRDLALYRAVVELGMPASLIGQALDLSKQRMSQIVRAVEDARDQDAVIAELLDGEEARQRRDDDEEPGQRVCV
jgi:hypothetical protein